MNARETEFQTYAAGVALDIAHALTPFIVVWIVAGFCYVMLRITLARIEAARR